MATTNKYLLGAVFALAFAGCAADGDIATGDGVGKDGKGKAYVTLSLSMGNVAPASRANPQGGESGDGYERGQSYENVVNSAVAFFYRADGVNAAATTPIDGVAEFNQFTAGDGITPVDKIYSAEPQQVALDNGEYHVIVVANPGDYKWWTGTTLNLGQVRDHIYKEAWKVDADGNYSDFLMASADDATLTLTSEATEEEPAEVSANVERVAARIDVYTQTDVFPCKDPAYKDGKVQLLGAAIVNNLTAGSYLLKRVNTTASDNGVTYLGDETADDNRVPTNYVIDPWTATKTEGNNSFTIGTATQQPASALYGVWFGNQNQTVIDPSGVSELLTPGYWDKLCIADQYLPQLDGGYRRLGYTLENTTAADCAGPRYTTGVVFKARFSPAKGSIPNYDAGTFFSRGSTLYASMEDMMEYVYGKSQFAQFDYMIQTNSTWGSILAWANTLYSEDPSGYVDFLKAECAKHDKDAPVTDEEKARLYWSAYMSNECGYSTTKTDWGTWVVKVNQNGKNTRTALRPHGVRTYEDAQCYYTWWVRHGNDNNDETNGVMEYGIVRNNVYKLDVKTVYSIGGDIPGDESLVVNVYVNDWLLLPTEELHM